MSRLRQVRRTDLHPGAEPIFHLVFGDRDPVADLMAHLRERQG